jgi:hypothetical protein
MFSLLLAIAFVTPTPRFVVIDSAVRARLAVEWDATNTMQPERGYCVAFVKAREWGVPVYRVWAIERAKIVTSSQYRLTSECPNGSEVAFLHTHPPVTCFSRFNCELGGVDAYECFPSEIDQAALDESTDAFGLIQCSREAIVFYFPNRKHNHE